jgi:hypothetical protein
MILSSTYTPAQALTNEDTSIDDQEDTPAGLHTIVIVVGVICW